MNPRVHIVCMSWEARQLIASSSTYVGWWVVHVVIVGGVNAWWWLRDRVERYAIISIIVGLDSRKGFDVVVGVQRQRVSVRICCKANAHTVVPSRHLSF
jgi:hypothetical protein